MAQTKWQLDPEHSEIEFKVKHMMINNVKGNFDSFQIEVNTENDNFEHASVNATIDTNSVSTRNEKRDEHLKSVDFFDTATYPSITFASTSFGNGKLEGNLSLHGITKPITFDVDFAGTQKDPWGNLKAGFTVEGKLKRSDFGLNWNAALEAGGVLVSDEVRFTADIQLVKSAE